MKHDRIRVEAATAYDRLVAYMAKACPGVGCSAVRDAHPDTIDAVLASRGMRDKVDTLRHLKAIDPFYYRNGMSRRAAKAGAA